MKIWQAIALGLGAFGAMIALIVFSALHFTAPARELSRNFFDALRAADIATIEAMAHPSLLQSKEYQAVKAGLEPQQPFERYFFNSSSWGIGHFKGEGQAWTSNGCESRLVIERRNSLVTRFSIYGSC